MFRTAWEYDRPSAAEEIARRHKRVKCELKKYYCDLCEDRAWTSESEVEIHKNKDHTDAMQELTTTDNVCLVTVPNFFKCLQKFETENDLMEHVKTDHLLSGSDATKVEREMFVCDTCDQIFFNKKMLTLHVESHMQTKSTYFGCPKCDRTLRIGNFWMHFEYHQIHSVATCSICLHKCQDRKALKDHMKSHPKHYQCDLCQFQTFRRENFYDHIKIHTPGHCDVPDSLIERCFTTNPMKKSKYPIRRGRYKSFKGLCVADHVRICVLCREICTDKAGMRRHVQIHSIGNRDEAANYICKCGEVFLNRILYKHHVFKVHDYVAT